MCVLHGNVKDGMQLYQAVVSCEARQTRNPHVCLPCMDCAKARDGEVKSSLSGQEYVVTCFGTSTKDGLRCCSCSKHACAESKARAAAAAAERVGAGSKCE